MSRAFLRDRIVRGLFSFVAILVPVIGLFLGCADDATRPESTPPSEEAQLIALCESGELRSPMPLALEVQVHLDKIRATFHESCPFVDSVAFRPPWQPGAILVGVTDSTATAIHEGRYHDWDELNSTYHMTEIRERFSHGYPYVVLVFADVLHPRRLATLYQGLPGVRYAEPNSYLFDFSNIYPRTSGDSISYLFRHGTGDCPSGCTHNDYWYFRVTDHGPQLVGAWDGNRNTQPAWWSDAKRNVDEYHRW